MATSRVPQIVLDNLLETILISKDVDVLRETAQWALQQLIEADVSAKIGAQRYEQTEERNNQRNGVRERSLDTRVGTLNLAIPKLRKGTYYPEWLLERQKPAEQSLISAIMEAYVNGVSTRKVDRLVSELGIQGMDKATVSRINKGLDERVKKFTERPLEDTYPYVWLDATFPKVREDKKVQSTALVVAMGVNKCGRREILGISIGATETEAFWLEFLRTLTARGLEGVKLVISDDHQGLTSAIGKVLTNASWQRCQVHFMKNILSHVAKSAQDEIASLVRTIFTQTSLKDAEEQGKRVIERLSNRFFKASEMLEEALPDLLAHMHFPESHWKRIRSNNPLERLNREIKRRFNVVGIFPNREAVIRLGGALLLEQHEEWLASNKHYFSEDSMALLKELENETGNNRGAP